MESKKWTSCIFLILFAAFIWGYSLADMLSPGREYSELENRYLAGMPGFTFRSLLDNTYTLKIEEHTNDRFMLRDAWITVKSISETALLKIENNNIIYGKDGFMFEKRLTYDSEQLERNLNSLFFFAEKFPGNNITLMLVPTSDIVLADKVPRGLHNVEQTSIIEDIHRKAGESEIRSVGLLEPLCNNRYEKIDTDNYKTFYRTDHHWTTPGAYAAYAAYVQSLGLASAEPFDFPLHTVYDFYGTFYSKAKLFNAKPDTIRWFDIPVHSVTINGEPKDGLYNHEKWNQRDKYAAFLHDNNGITVLDSTGKQDGENKTRILVFKDSYGNAFAPFLTFNFDEVTVIDLRYFMEVESLMNSGDYDEILFLYGFPSFSNETSIVNLRL
ncbi:MAG: DHHW family protein [Oscillospiraceae bacterium]|nr:DHHW family protein [Oscillospiraceae bacterium]